MIDVQKEALGLQVQSSIVIFSFRKTFSKEVVEYPYLYKTMKEGYLCSQ